MNTGATPKATDEATKQAREIVEVWVHQYKNLVFSTAIGYTAGNTAAAEDLAQEAFLRAFRAVQKTIEDGGDGNYQRVGGFLKLITQNLGKNYARDRNSFQRRLFAAGREMIAKFAGPTNTAAAAVAAGEVNVDSGSHDGFDNEDVVSRALARLPEPLRMALVLVEYQQLSEAEAAKELGIPRGTVKSRLFKARGLLRQDPEMVDLWKGR